MKRKVLYISGTRADYGLMRNTLGAIEHHPELSLAIVVSGMHLDPAFGETVQEIEGDGFAILGRVATHDCPRTGAGMARGIGLMIVEFTALLEAHRPDIVLLLGDRGEMLAGAISALHLNIPVAHIHGGERSGTVDEPVRHAISKLAHLHLAATSASRDRLVRMGERPSDVFVVGAPGLDGMGESVVLDREQLARRAGIDAALPIALFVYHPVLQEADTCGETADAILSALIQHGIQVIALKPNADGGSDLVAKQLERHRADAQLRVYTHLERNEFVSWMAAVDFMIGNSSAGIIEAASFGLPVINVGPRQNLRERNANVVDVTNEPHTLDRVIDNVLKNGRGHPSNVYGDGLTGPRVADLLARIDLDGLVWKCNAY